ncbi:hypothetical protein CRG98_001065 [Punica granatum]|uniref:DUF7745 domain-containing protein n=1 Tax=Punica granatum TaxID=22663 RepID=A0A2I0LD02_PUNGR|nr:hypothetical protein CRG98_001065 [Punica granatum]
MALDLRVVNSKWRLLFTGVRHVPGKSQLSSLLDIPTRDIHEELHQGWDHGIRIAWLSDWTFLRALTPSTASYQCDACHGFLLLVFGNLLFPYSPNLIDGAIAQVILQAVGGHSYVEVLLAETVQSLDYVREVRRSRIRGSPHLLQIWLLAHIRPFCSSHPFSYIADERSLIERLVPVIPPPEHSFSEWRRFWRELTPSWIFPPKRTAYLSASNGPTPHPRPPIDSYKFGRAAVNGTLAPYSACISPNTPPTRNEHSLPHQHTWPGSTRRDRRHHNGPRPPRLPEAESSIQAAMHAELRAVKEERDRLRCELVDSRAENIACPLHTFGILGDRNWRRTVTRPVSVSGWWKGIESISPKKSTHRFRLILNHPRCTLHHLPLLQAYSRRIRVPFQHISRPRQLLALLRGPNRASSSSTPPPGPRPTVDPTPGAPPTQAPENIEAPAPPTLHTSAVHPFTNPFPPPPAPTAVPLPPAAFLSSEHVLSAPPPVSIPAPAMAYTIPPPMVFPAPSAPAPTHLQAAELPSYPSLQPHVGLSYQAPPPINATFHEPGTPTHAAQFASPTHFFPEADAEQERRLRRMEETIRALQAGDARPDARYGDKSLFPGMRLPPKFKIPEFKTYEGTTDPRHHLRHYRGKMLQY